MLRTGQSVVIHCSDGWDRTPQLSALSQLLLDPFFRTLRGFGVLVEKEWTGFGHKFHDRMGRCIARPKETSPVWLQFLECVWHLTCQFPRAFQFNENFLLQLHAHSNSGRFGTFLHNTQRERVEANLQKTTFSVWDYLFRRPDCQNGEFEPSSNS